MTQEAPEKADLARQVSEPFDRCAHIASVRRAVVKVGTNVLTRETGEMALGRIHTLIEDIVDLKRSGLQVIVVSSGAISMGMDRLGFKKRPTTLPDKQACASVGQIRLMSIYEQAFERFGMATAQILLTEDDFASRVRYLNLRNTVSRLLDHNVIPIINENDAVSTSEIETSGQEAVPLKKSIFGDNDRLSALVMSKLGADLLILLSDVDGLYPWEDGEDEGEGGNQGCAPDARSEANAGTRADTGATPGTGSIADTGALADADAKAANRSKEGAAGRRQEKARRAKASPAPLSIVREITPQIEAYCQAGGPRGRGGMISKLKSIKVALEGGGLAVIANGTRSGILREIFDGKEVGTVFLPRRKIPSRKRWIAYASAPAGRVVVNAGARDALVKRRSSLLFAGVVRIEAEFRRGDVVTIVDETGEEFGRGIVNYASHDAAPLLGKRSSEIAKVAGQDYEEFIHRDNIVLME